MIAPLGSIPARLRWYGGAPRRWAARRRYAALSKKPIEPTSIALWGYLDSEIGLGSAARGMAAALLRVDPALNYHTIPMPGRDHAAFPRRPARGLSKTNIFMTNPAQFFDAHTYIPHEFMRDTRRIGHWYWELSSTPREWLAAYELVDEIWASTVHSAEAFQRATKKPVRIAPPVVEDWAHRSTAEARALFPGLPQDGFLFLAIFDFASGSKRKNPHGMVAAFNAAFPQHGKDQPYLVLKYHSAGYNRQAEAELREAMAKNPNILIMDELLTEDRMRDLKDACDCYVSLHRAEGFGLNLADSMLARKPVICTAYSGNVDFTDIGDAFPVGYKIVKLGAGDYYYFAENQEWAEPDLDDAVSAMRLVYEDRGLAQRRGEAGRERILAHYSMDAVVPALKALLGRSPDIGPKR